MDFDIVRAFEESPELRTDRGDTDGLGILSGHFSVFDSWYPVTSTWEGDFMERIAPGAFTQTIAEDADHMRVLFDHGMDPQIGNKVLGYIESLGQDDTGPAYEVQLLDTGYNRELVPGLRAGVYGASFRFRVREETWVDEPDVSDTNPKGIAERTVTNAKVMEFGPVTFPANPEATAGVRSVTDQFYDRLRARDTSAYQAAARAAGITLTGADVARSSSRGDAVTNQTRDRVFQLRKRATWT